MRFGQTRPNTLRHCSRYADDKVSRSDMSQNSLGFKLSSSSSLHSLYVIQEKQALHIRSQNRRRFERPDISPRRAQSRRQLWTAQAANPIYGEDHPHLDANFGRISAKGCEGGSDHALDVGGNKSVGDSKRPETIQGLDCDP